MNARLIGINSAIYSQSGGSIGIGFAIPVNMVKSVVAAARNGVTRVRRPWLGASLQVISREIADGLGLDRPTGALVADVQDSSPAANAGLKRGDILAAVDGAGVDDPDAFGYRLATKPLGGTAALKVQRGSQTLDLVLHLIAAPEVPPREPIKLDNTSPFSGATIVNLSPAVADDMSITGTHEGVVVADVDEGSVASDTGIEKGDIILVINNTKISSTKVMEKATATSPRSWRVTLLRGGQIIQSDIGG
jgi:S1-C subfamily serine protease